MQRQNQINLAIGAVAVILVVVLAGSLVRAIMQPLEHAMKVAATVAQGDLTLPIRTDGDHEFTRLLESLKAMQSHLSATLMRVQENTTEVASASSQIAAANLDLSARTEAQASSLRLPLNFGALSPGFMRRSCAEPPASVARIAWG